MLSPDNNITPALTHAHTPKDGCAVCRERAERQADLRAHDRNRAQEREAARIARQSYQPNGASETYDGPRDEAGEPFPYCVFLWEEAVRREKERNELSELRHFDRLEIIHRRVTEDLDLFGLILEDLLQFHALKMAREELGI